MKRDYESGTTTGVTFFVGKEIEQTPAFGKTTLFVVGVQDVEEILHLVKNYPLANIEHIYFGANQSFPRLRFDDVEGWAKWEEMIEKCLDAGYLCTLDLDVNQVEGLLESFLVEHHLFIPQISVKIPYLTQLGYNATIKIDDKDFKATNPGVWCLPISDVTQRKYFTSWSEYKNDEIIK